MINKTLRSLLILCTAVLIGSEISHPNRNQSLSRKTKSVMKKYIIDYDGNGHSDFAVFSIKDNALYFRNRKKQKWTMSYEIPIPIMADFSGDKKTNIAFFDKGTWYIFGHLITSFGTKGDIPVPGDYNGDGKADIAVWRPATGTWFLEGEKNPITWGENHDVPVPFDYDGDGQTDIDVWRPASGTWFIKYAQEKTDIILWGKSGDIPVPGDYNGDGKGDIAVWRPSEGNWYIQGQDTFSYGKEGDIPVPGDYNGDGATDITIWRPATGIWFLQNRKRIRFGLSNDLPITWNTWIYWKKGLFPKNQEK